MLTINETDLNRIQDALMAAQRALEPERHSTRNALASIIAAQCLVACAKDSKADPAERAAAFDKYGSDDIEIDDEASVSRGDDGYFVSAWVWIEREEQDECEHDWGGPPSLGAECLVCGAQCEEPVNADGSPINDGDEA